MRTFKKTRTGDKNLDAVQDNVLQFANQLLPVQLLNGILLTDVELSGSTAVSHRLGRIPVGYIVVNRDANASIWTNSIDAQFLNLQTSATVTVSLWVF